MDTTSRPDDRRALLDAKLTERVLFAKQLCPSAAVEGSAIQYEDEDGGVEMFPPPSLSETKRTGSRWRSPRGRQRSSPIPGSTSSARSWIQLPVDPSGQDPGCYMQDFTGYVAMRTCPFTVLCADAGLFDVIPRTMDENHQWQPGHKDLAFP